MEIRENDSLLLALGAAIVHDTARCLECETRR